MLSRPKSQGDPNTEPEFLTPAQFNERYPCDLAEPVAAWLRLLNGWRAKGRIPKPWCQYYPAGPTVGHRYNTVLVARLIREHKELPRQPFCTRLWLLHAPALQQVIRCNDFKTLVQTINKSSQPDD